MSDNTGNLNINQNHSSIAAMQDRIQKTNGNNAVKAGQINGMTFEQIFHQRIEGLTVDTPLKFSKHAGERMDARNIDLSNEQLERLEDGAKAASKKGIKDSLIMVDDFAFIVNISNKTVITAVGADDEKVFTNIDGAVIA